jgi:hypothetical protein
LAIKIIKLWQSRSNVLSFLLDLGLVVQKGNIGHSAIKTKNRSGRAGLRMAKKAGLAIAVALTLAIAAFIAAAGHHDLAGIYMPEAAHRALAGIYMPEVVIIGKLCVGAALIARNCAL